MVVSICIDVPGLAREFVGICIITVRTVACVACWDRTSPCRDCAISIAIAIAILVPSWCDSFIDETITVLIDQITYFCCAWVDTATTVITVVVPRCLRVIVCTTLGHTITVVVVT